MKTKLFSLIVLLLIAVGNVKAQNIGFTDTNYFGGNSKAEIVALLQIPSQYSSQPLRFYLFKWKCTVDMNFDGLPYVLGPEHPSPNHGSGVTRQVVEFENAYDWYFRRPALSMRNYVPNASWAKFVLDESLNPHLNIDPYRNTLEMNSWETLW